MDLFSLAIMKHGREPKQAQGNRLGERSRMEGWGTERNYITGGRKSPFELMHVSTDDGK